MTSREAKIAALAASLSFALGVGSSQLVVGKAAAAGATQLNAVHLYRTQDPDAGAQLGLEVCGATTDAPAVDGGDPVIVAQGCVSGPLPAACATEAQALAACARSYWKTQKGVP